MTNKEIRNKVKWKDLRKMSLKEILIENNITLPWLIASLTLAYFEYYLLAIPFSVYFFLTGLRQVHNGFHNALGTNRFMTWFTLYSNSILMMVSVHAVKFNHLRHHKYCLTEADFEGKSARMTWYGALLYGPIHIFQILRVTHQLGNKSYRKNLYVELISLSAFAFAVFYFNIHFLMYHVVIMVLAEFTTAFFAVWTVHHDAKESVDESRTQRTKWKNRITFGMFYHLEHHLFPAISTIKLPELAERIDKALPNLIKKPTF
ncbi:MAG: fatty acid desaturase [Flavobacteriales bacterium]|nr:fatty acid desaturase [Flavobacteriales bacterium]